mmetsp:Transcript_14124/g.26205  ORF Transcript_14124/g.26205 Transcript_14124/m.26205 type:complete len:85 (+) Transcript_14124:12-266(+)
MHLHTVNFNSSMIGKSSLSRRDQSCPNGNFTQMVMSKEALNWPSWPPHKNNATLCISHPNVCSADTHLIEEIVETSQHQHQLNL